MRAVYLDKRARLLLGSLSHTRKSAWSSIGRPSSLRDRSRSPYSVSRRFLPRHAMSDLSLQTARYHSVVVRKDGVACWEPPQQIVEGRELE